jgi:hypothetical protein
MTRVSGRRNGWPRLVDRVLESGYLIGTARSGPGGLGSHPFHPDSVGGKAMKTVRAVALIGAGILCFSLAALLIIVTAVMILIVPRVEAGLTHARVQTLLAQGEIIAMAIASQAMESDAINIDPERLLELQAGETYGSSDTLFGFEFPVNPERVAPLLRRLITPINTRARIYDRDGTLILDTRNLYGRGDVLRFDLPPPTVEQP